VCVNDRLCTSGGHRLDQGFEVGEDRGEVSQFDVSVNVGGRFFERLECTCFR